MSKLERNQKIKELYSNGMAQAEIARLFEITRQRVKQILENRDKIPYLMAHTIKQNKTCFLCDSNQKLHIHHLNGDASNSDPSNLIVLCKEHHLSVHQKNKRHTPCEHCGSPYRKTAIYKNGDKKFRFCRKCYIAYKEQQRYEKLNYKCNSCGEIKPHHSNGMCYNCYYKSLYKTNQKRRAYLIAKTIEWKEKNPERSREINRKAGIKWSRANKEATNKRLRERYANDEKYREKLKEKHRLSYLNKSLIL